MMSLLSVNIEMEVIRYGGAYGASAGFGNFLGGLNRGRKSKGYKRQQWL
jgi:hypothetical protein